MDLENIVKPIESRRKKTTATILKLKYRPFITERSASPSATISRPKCIKVQNKQGHRRSCRKSDWRDYEKCLIFSKDYEAISYRNLSVGMQNGPDLYCMIKTLQIWIHQPP